MKKLLRITLAVSCLLFAVSALNAAPIPLSTTTEITSTAIARFRAYHGESVRLTHRLTLAGAPLDLSGASARFYWRTEEMEDWWSTDATLEGDAVSCDFTPEMDPGTEAIWYFFGITQEKSIAYRANGSLTLLDSPGFIPADLGEPDALAAALEALFKEADSRYATRAQLAANSEQLTDLKDALNAKQDKLTVDSTLSASSTNPIQNQAVKAALDKKAEKSHTHTTSQVSGLQTQLNNMTNTLNNKASKTEFNSDNINLPYVKAYGASMHSLRTVFNANNEADNWAEKFDNAKLTFEWWHQYNNVKEDSFDVPMTAFRALAAGGSTKGLETWADDGTAGIDPSKTFVGVDASHVFHANGQIHGAQMLSADTNKRLYVPFDLMQNDEERWLSAASVWNGNRNIIFNGDTTTLVQPLVPTNKGDNAAYVPYALPCFENSPIFWKGQMIWHDGTTTLSKSVSIPWSRVTGTTASPSELALKSDLETLKSEPAPPTLEVATWSGTVCSVPWGTNPLLIDCTDLEVADVVFSFPIDSWPEGALRTLILRTGAMTDATGMGTLLHAFTQQDATLLTAKIHGYEVFPTGEEIICSAMRLGNTIHLTTTMRSSL